MTEFVPSVGLHPGLANDIYHAQTEWWSSTQLKRFWPEHYKAFSGNTDALAFGTLFHEVVLEPDNLDHYAVLDAEAIGVKSDGTPAANPLMTAAWKKAVAEAEQDDKTVVAQADWDRAQRMRDALMAHDTAPGLIWGSEGANEESAFWIDGDGRQHKARFDRRIPGAVIDLKSTSAKPGSDSLSRACIDYGYELSAAHYLAVAEGLALDVEAFVHVWVEKVEPFRVTVSDLPADFIARGHYLRDHALMRAAQQIDAYEGATGFITLELPRWARI